MLPRVFLAALRAYSRRRARQLVFAAAAHAVDTGVRAHPAAFLAALRADARSPDGGFDRAWQREVVAFRVAAASADLGDKHRVEFLGRLGLGEAELLGSEPLGPLLVVPLVVRPPALRAPRNGRIRQLVQASRAHTVCASWCGHVVTLLV